MAAKRILNLTKRLLREPLVHFLVLGSVFFVVGATRDTTMTPYDSEIVVSEGTIESLAMQWKRTWQRPPTREELADLVDDYVREELYYREAKRLGLDENDTIIRRRLRQKMEFIAEDLAISAERDERALEAFFESHIENYRRETRYSFTQVYFNPDKQREGLHESFKGTLEQLRRQTLPIEGAGDATLLPTRVVNASDREVLANFGPEFLESLDEMERGRWMGPISSGLGIHAVYLEERVEGEVPALAEIQAQVENDWYATQRVKAEEQLVAELRKGYTVKVEYPEWATMGLEQ